MIGETGMSLVVDIPIYRLPIFSQICLRAVEWTPTPAYTPLLCTTLCTLCHSLYAQCTGGVQGLDSQNVVNGGR